MSDFVKTSAGDGRNPKKRNRFNRKKKSIPPSMPQVGTSIQPSPTKLESKIIGRITIFPSKILGKGEDTKVYEGLYDGRSVAVKRISYEVSDQQKALNEIDMLLKCDKHENVVKYFAKEVLDNEFVYIALELCQFSLEEWVLKPPPPAKLIPKPSILEQVTRGLQYLHKLNIVHRDLKPQNILLSTLTEDEFRVKISDFGISKKLPVGRTSQTLHTGSGTIGWMAPEILQFNLKSNEMAKMTRRTDIFSLGCVFYYVLSNGKHPFGENNITIPNNVLNSTQFISLRDIKYEHIGCVRLIQQMISEEPKHRPETPVILSHHLFWSKKKALQFCVDISNATDFHGLAALDHFSHCLRAMDKHYSVLTYKQWIFETSPNVQEYILTDSHRRYRLVRMDLIRFIRNMQNHMNGLPHKVKTEFGRLPDEFMDYWLKRFPFLIDMLWSSFHTLRKKTEYNLKDYYWSHGEFQFRKLTSHERNVFDLFISTNSS